LINWKIPLYKILVDDEDVKSVSKVIKRGADWAIGPEIANFENMMSNYIGSTYCLTFNSGTSALHAALLALGIKKGDEVLVPSFTFIATANACLMVNAQPKFVDIEEETLGLNPELIDSSITDKCKAVMPIHYAGLPCKIKEICDITRERKIPLIEDAAESLGSKINNKKIGTFGDLAVFSFAGNKVLTTGEGGCITTDSKKLYEKLKLIRSHGRVENRNYFTSVEKPRYVELGYNWRMSSMTAALAISQLNKLEKLINLRRNNAKYLSSKLRKLKEIKVPQEPMGYKHVYQLYSIRLENKKMRDGLMKFLAKRGIMSKVFFYPVHSSPFYKKMSGINRKLQITEKVSDQILTLPMYPGLTKSQLDLISNSVSEFIEQT